MQRSAAVIILLIISTGVFAIAAYGSSYPLFKPRSQSSTQNPDKQRTDKPKGQKSEEPSQDDVLRLKTTLVTSDVLVIDRKGHAVSGLRREDFIVREDDVVQQISAFALGNDASIPRSIVLIIDYSASQLPFLKNSIEAAKRLVDQLNPQDKMAIVTDDVSLLAEFTNDKGQLKKNLDSLKRKASSGDVGQSRQFSALMATLNEMFDDEELRPIIIFQTDGDEFHRLPSTAAAPSVNRFTLDDLFVRAQKSRATIYTVIPSARLIGIPPAEQAQQAKKFYPGMNEMSAETVAFRLRRILSEQMAIASLAKLTGGWFDYLESPSQAEQVYARMLSDMNLRYLIGYYPTNEARDGKRRKVKIEVRDHPDYTLLSRKTYYAPTS